MTIDAVDLTARLVRCASVTPAEGGALQLLDALLSEAGFTTTRVDREGTPNLLAQWGGDRNGKQLGFNGHTDVVPIGVRDDWSVDPFGAEIIDGYLYGRGATDMKSGVAAFVAAAVAFVQETPPDGGLILAITGDEEGEAKHGTRALLDHMAEHAIRMDACIVGEPTSTAATGDVVKIGRRGSMTAYVTATGLQGHAAYPQKALNPLHGLTLMLADLTATPLDDGSAHFDPTTLQITTIDTGNPANNVIPGAADATVNIRFSDQHTSETVQAHINAAVARATQATGTKFAIRWHISGESFLTPPGELSDLVSGAIQATTGLTPALSTSGGTSDARFVKAHCPVIEVGLVGERMHAVDERVKVAHINTLTAIYRRILTDFFAQ